MTGPIALCLSLGCSGQAGPGADDTQLSNANPTEEGLAQLSQALVTPSIPLVKSHWADVKPAKGKITVRLDQLDNSDPVLAVIRWRDTQYSSEGEPPRYTAQGRFDIVAYNDDASDAEREAQTDFEADGSSTYRVIVMPFSTAQQGSAVLSFQNCVSCPSPARVPVVGSIASAAQENVLEVTSTSSPDADPWLFAFHLSPRAGAPGQFEGIGLSNDDGFAIGGTGLPQIRSDLRFTSDDVLLITNFGDIASGSTVTLSTRLDSTPVVGLPTPATPLNGKCKLRSSDGSVPRTLAETGCFRLLSNGNLSEFPVSGTIPYEVAHPFWSDGVVKERALAIPDGKWIQVDSNGEWTLPDGGVMIKNFRFGASLFETRLVGVVGSDEVAYTYAWGIDPATGKRNALRVDDPTVNPSTSRTVALTGDVKLADRNWTYPNSDDCATCHNGGPSFFLGLKAAQFNIDVNYPQTGLVANQITTLEKLQLLKFDSQFNRQKLAAGLPARPDSVAGRNYSPEQARAYLDVNCSYCHNNTVGAMNKGWFASFDGAFNGMKVCNPDLGVNQKKIVVPHSPYIENPDPNTQNQSKLMLRMESLDPDASPSMMPPLSKTVTDKAGLRLIGRWIADLAPSCASPTVALKSLGLFPSAGVCLTVTNQTPNIVRATACAATNALQSFTIVDDGGGFVSLRLGAATCVQETATAGQVLAGACVSQAWRRVPLAGGGFELRSKDNLRCLQAATGSMRAVACSASPYQAWASVAR
ncbi:MAG TPA: hypothetical protein VJV79_31155 [Polyangiaceae bacterium]|nr:hypothetical protein [Polyangiaceae bacterium]